MAVKTGDGWRKPAPARVPRPWRSSAGCSPATSGSRPSQTESQMVGSLRAAEKARENLAADLQNLQKAAGTAADLKVQATEAEKALSEAVGRPRLGAERTRRSHQADQRRKARDFRRAGRGERQDRAISRRWTPASRRRPTGSRRCKARTRPRRRQAGCRVRSTPRAPRSPTRRAQTASAQKQLESLQSQINAATAELNALQQQLRECRKRRRSGALRRSACARAHETLVGVAGSLPSGDERVTTRLAERAGDRSSGTCARERGNMDDLTATDTADAAHVDLDRRPTAAELKAAVLAKLTYSVGKVPEVASPRDWFLAVAFATRDLIVDRWLRLDRRRLRRRAQARLLSLARIPDRPAAVRRHDQSRRRRADGRSAARTRRQPDASCGGSSRTRRSATAASAASPPASWTAWRRFRSPRTATASATTTAFSARSFATAGSRKRPRTGSPTAIPGSSSGWNTITPSASAAGSKWSQGDDERTRHIWHPARNGRGGRLRHADRRLARPARQHAAPVVGARARPVQARRLQRRRLRRRPVGRRAGARRSPRCSIRATRRRPARNCASAGIFLRLRLAARSRPPPHQAARRHPHARRPRGDPAQRHPSGDRRRRTDAHPRRPERTRLGRGLDSHAGDLLLHQPHASARSARKLAGSADGAAAAAPHADHLSDQRGASRQRAPARFRGFGHARVDLADRRARGPAGAHGQPRLHRLAQDQRRLRRCTPT